MIISMKFVHVNIIAKDWEKLAHFYEKTFGCIRLEPERNLSGEVLEKGTGISNAGLKGVHLKLPGYKEDGPTLEIFQYNQNENRTPVLVNREGFGHIAFAVDDIEKVRSEILAAGGQSIGEVVTLEIEGAGKVSFLYLTDSEGNVIELQKWI